MIDAKAAETRISIQGRGDQRIAPPQPRRVGPSSSARDHAQDLRREQNPDGQLEQLQRAHVVESAADVGNSENSAVKYSGRMYFDLIISTMPTSNCAIHSGEAR